MRKMWRAAVAALAVVVLAACSPSGTAATGNSSSASVSSAPADPQAAYLGGLHADAAKVPDLRGWTDRGLLREGRYACRVLRDSPPAIAISVLAHESVPPLVAAAIVVEARRELCPRT